MIEFWYQKSSIESLLYLSLINENWIELESLLEYICYTVLSRITDVI